MMFLTKSSFPVIGQVAVLLGLLMNGIFIAQSAIGLENIGLCIILFTIVVYMLMTPLTIQQQKYTKLTSKMNPELQAIQKKYKGKNSDQAAMQKMNEETQAVYAKYGVNPMGSCVQMIIQIPILFALYRVIWNIPAYVQSVKDAFTPLATQILSTNGAEEYFTEAAKTLNVTFKEMNLNTLIDVLYKFKPSNWTALAEKFPDLSSLISTTQSGIDKMNYFLGLNIADSPMNIFTSAMKSKAILLMIGAALIPILAAVTQWLNSKLMTVSSDSSKGGDQQTDQMANTMKSMNTIMPLMSAVFCLSLPVGLGIYWIAGAVVRSIQQVVINKKLDSIDTDELVRQNIEKMNKKRIKDGLPPEKMQNNAKITTRNISVPSNKASVLREKADLAGKAGKTEGGSSGMSVASAKPGSLAAKANMVKDYNEKHTRK